MIAADLRGHRVNRPIVRPCMQARAALMRAVDIHQVAKPRAAGTDALGRSQELMFQEQQGGAKSLSMCSTSWAAKRRSPGTSTISHLAHAKKTS